MGGIPLPSFLRKNELAFGFKRFATPGYVRFVRWMGIVEMTFAVLSVVVVVAMSLLGINW